MALISQIIIFERNEYNEKMDCIIYGAAFGI